MHKQIMLISLGVVSGAAAAVVFGPDHTVIQTLALAGLISGHMVLLASIAWRLDRAPS